MLHISKNNIIQISRGDSGEFSFTLNLGNEIFPNVYNLQAYNVDGESRLIYDNVYFGVMEPHVKFDDSIIRYSFNCESADYNKGAVTIKLKTSDTEFLRPGVYYWEVKLQRVIKDSIIDIDTYDTQVDTLISRKKFIIME